MSVIVRGETILLCDRNHISCNVEVKILLCGVDNVSVITPAKQLSDFAKETNLFHLPRDISTIW